MKPRIEQLADLERELVRRLRQSARVGSLQVRVEHRIDETRRKIERKRAELDRLDNAMRIAGRAGIRRQ